jgi:hypothetical protein
MFSTKYSDRDVDLLLSGETPQSDDLAELAEFVEIIRAQGAPGPSEAAVARFAAKAAQYARQSPSPITGGQVPARRPALARLRPQVALTLVALFMLSGVAVAADAAVPGSTLYPIDRALENVGIGNGRSAERLEEAGALIADGRVEAALAHATEALDESDLDDPAGVEQAKAAMIAASERLSSSPDAGEVPGAELRNVSALLSYLEANLGEEEGRGGREFGQGVADLARLISMEKRGESPVVDPGPADDETADEVGGGPAVSPANDGRPPADPPGQSDADREQTGNGNGVSGNGDQGNDNGGRDNGSRGNGPPDESPSITAPGRPDRP